MVDIASIVETAKNLKSAIKKIEGAKSYDERGLYSEGKNDFSDLGEFCAVKCIEAENEFLEAHRRDIMNLAIVNIKKEIEEAKALLEE